MKNIYLIISIIFLYASCSINKRIDSTEAPKSEVPVIYANDKMASFYQEGENDEANWIISPELNPDDYVIFVPEGEKIKIHFKTDVDSLSYVLKPGEIFEFLVLLNNKDTAYTRLIAAPEPAIFSDEYIKMSKGKTLVEITDVYELINIIIAITPLSGMENSHFVIKDTPYYQEVIEWFEPFKNEKIVSSINEALKIGMNNMLKMDSYSFGFDENEIVNKGIYDRVSWGSSNTLLPYLKDMEAFAVLSNFNSFYKKHQKLYDKQIDYYKNKVNIQNMQNWLNENFPTTYYDGFKVIFSPLVGWNQSASWFENNNYKEAQAHVNFPYRSKSDSIYSEKANLLSDGSILFTEFNHAFINPEADKYLESSSFKKGFEDLKFWIEGGDSPASSYNSPFACFTEMMNWSLVCLYYLDYAPKEELEKMITGVEKNQVSKRGFKQFKAFNQKLIDLYENKKPDSTVADLYPEIIDWCSSYYRSNSN